MYLVTAEEMREMDRRTIEEFGIPGRVLMENAGRGATDILCSHVPDIKTQKVGVACGKGNNGGDGFVIARGLAERGVHVVIYLLCKTGDLTGDAKANLALVQKMGLPLVEITDKESLREHQHAMQGFGVWVDAILGTGLSTPVRGLYGDVIQIINDSNAFVFAVDIASGLFADSGQCGLCIQADATATFGFAKVGHMVMPGSGLTGKLHVVDIGIPKSIAKAVGAAHRLISPQLLGPALDRPKHIHKGDLGRLLVIAGSPGKTGAAAMASMSAMRAGAGLVTLAAPQSLCPVLEGLVIEAMTSPLAETQSGEIALSAQEAVKMLLAEKTALAIGPGLGTHEETGKLVQTLLLECPVPMIADADALNLIAQNPTLLKRAPSPVILTPHPGEMARLTGLSAQEIQENRTEVAREFAVKNQVHVVLKGANTVVAHPDGLVCINPTGNPGMASGGMGDVLTGLIGAFLAQGLGPERSARLGVFVHGAAADLIAENIAPAGYLATDVMSMVPKALAGVWKNA
ncbi:NAD(P)H-hydrate epimerase [Desulfatibacillum alkenivorans DSM 16219]|uniref:Bifunctional NAD(P)H-hydrate repair enzyme n=1 Tax=Desulfatibacillum alkenivorans DSM 16219 TaxID=1121393 RepID=A0A1M6URS1_9BACT|nr:bifunctional ADP-dependent NAD(P)H-hydrate dehydratase/NAD(P)H-hydrate epimerase [Desulfatibacillum alkenivorans]SHK71880.1 NAD(P)H-hydrate epimerase [Desulfatibacillum alkenivorans DSM 16219]